MTRRMPTITRALAMGASLLALVACDGFDPDLRDRAGGFSTAEAARQPLAARPRPDARGVISYPDYQVAVAQQGDTVASIAARVGIGTAELAGFNGIAADAPLRRGEILALPRRVAADGGAFGAPAAGGAIDVSTLAGSAIDRAEAGAGVGAAVPSGTITPAAGSAAPVRHQVVRGETAYSIARLYGVSVRALADWNGIGPDLTVREGAYLMIPPADGRVAAAAAPREEVTPPPGAGSPTPVPPSAAAPLPAQNETAAAPSATPPSPNLEQQRTAASATGRLAMPVQGSIIRAYQKGRNEGIDISATAGADVKAAEAGTVAAVTRSTDNVAIVIVRHEGARFGSSEPILTVYANLEGITVERGATVQRGQTIGKVRAGNPAFMRFEVRRGFETLDPSDFLQ